MSEQIWIFLLGFGSAMLLCSMIMYRADVRINQLSGELRVLKIELEEMCDVWGKSDE